MVAQEIKINCKECMGDRHDNCLNPDSCLCADPSYNHGEHLRYGVKVNDKLDPPGKEPLEYELALRDAQRLENFMDNGLGNNSPTFVLIELTKLLICSKHLVSKFDLVRELKEWCKKYRVEESEIDTALEIVFGDMEVFYHVKRISKALGMVKKNTLFDKTQLIEVGEWLKGRYFIKRVEVTGDLLFFNDQYYEQNAEALIRRNARSVIAKSKNTDMNEVVRYIEDTCDIITWKDIEKSIHLKCLLNGIYNIKTGIFSEKFDPDYIILNQIPHNYNESESYDIIDETIKTIIPDEKNRQSYYDFISSCLHPYTGIDFQFGSVGGTGTGKSQLGVLAELVLGENNVKDSNIQTIAEDPTTQKNVAFKMLNIDYDLSDESIEKINVLKKWITQDKFTARGIYEQSSDFRPMSRLMFMANDLYEIVNPDDSEAIYDRTYIIRVDKKFRHQDSEIKNVMKKVSTVPQLEGFITYLLKNATWMFEHESYHNKIDVKDVEAIWNTFGNRIKMFTEKWIEKGVSYRTESNDPFNKWMSYCISHNFKPKTKKHFRQIFDEIVGNTPTKTRIDEHEVYAYTGFRMKTDEEIADQETPKFSGDKALEALDILPSLLLLDLFSNIKKKVRIKELLELNKSDNSKSNLSSHHSNYNEDVED